HLAGDGRHAAGAGGDGGARPRVPLLAAGAARPAAAGGAAAARGGGATDGRLPPRGIARRGRPPALRVEPPGPGGAGRLVTLLECVAIPPLSFLSFPNGVWERPPAKLRFAPPSELEILLEEGPRNGVSGTCVPKRSLGTRVKVGRRRRSLAPQLLRRF